MSQRSFLDQLVHDLIRSKQTNYSQDCIPYYLDQQQLLIEDLPKVYNNRHEKLKCTLVRHRNRDKSKENDTNLNKKCILYLHGLGSSRLEALNIAQALPRHYCFCMFDLSGSGKSQGEYITYGLKEQEDIAPVIQYLHRKKHIQEFVLWGRSMGAVATLLYALQNYQERIPSPTRGMFSATQSLRSSLIHNKSVASLEEQSLVKGIVLDSPFHNFRDIARQIATQRVGVPNFILDIALNYVEESFARLLGQTIGEKYNPFRINFNNQIRLTIPILFLHSEKDEIVPTHHCQRIIRNITSRFEKVPINDCTHNQSRPESVIADIFRKLDKFDRQQCYQQKKLTESISKDMSMSYSCQRKRGIFVYTPSKEKDRKSTIQYEKPSLRTLRGTIEVDMIRTEELQRSPRSCTSQVRKNPISLKCSRRVRQQGQRSEIGGSDNYLASLNTIDLQTNKLLNQKLSDIKDSDCGISKIVRSKRLALDKRKQLKLTHHKYLE